MSTTETLLTALDRFADAWAHLNETWREYAQKQEAIIDAMREETAAMKRESDALIARAETALNTATEPEHTCGECAEVFAGFIASPSTINPSPHDLHCGISKHAQRVQFDTPACPSFRAKEETK